LTGLNQGPIASGFQLYMKDLQLVPEFAVSSG